MWAYSLPSKYTCESDELCNLWSSWNVSIILWFSGPVTQYISIIYCLIFSWVLQVEYKTALHNTDTLHCNWFLFFPFSTTNSFLVCFLLLMLCIKLIISIFSHTPPNPFEMVIVCLLLFRGEYLPSPFSFYSILKALFIQSLLWFSQAM